MILQKYLHGFNNTSTNLVLRNDLKDPIHLKHVHIKASKHQEQRIYNNLKLEWFVYRMMLQAHTVHKPEKQHKVMESIYMWKGDTILYLISSFTI